MRDPLSLEVQIGLVAVVLTAAVDRIVARRANQRVGAGQSVDPVGAEAATGALIASTASASG